jgi:hypothetical protein
LFALSWHNVTFRRKFAKERGLKSPFKGRKKMMSKLFGKSLVYIVPGSTGDSAAIN